MQKVEVPVLLLDSVIQTIEELMHSVEEDAVMPDHQAVLEEVRDTLLPKEEPVQDGAKEERPAAPVEAEAETVSA